ncbi:related to protoporphyrinogen oxidase [Phialocephala subalpina]|uniref:Related to protoporphyrinogen oxidase n=1 Tax=Phialocephala subalpina TaxID=576137 RepID=A0A1L7X6T4_9HELO|nr:related to protoporphyrinogen oxidase [Phialocephala subalpina]
MPSYVVTGASRGIGLGLIQALSSYESNQVFAIIRDPATAPALYSLAKTNPNIHIIIGEVTKPEDMDLAAQEVAKVTSGKLDVLINNVGGGNNRDMPADYIGKPSELKAAMLESLDINLFGALYTTDSFLPLIRAGETKKIICISTGMADLDLMLKSEIPFALGYSMSKSALNAMVAKYAVQFRGEGIKLLSLSPGWVATHTGPEADMAREILLPAFQKVYPELKGQITTEESIRMQLEVIEKLTLEQSGQFLSHHGDKIWV